MPPSPRSPPPPVNPNTAFPYCACARNATNTPYALRPASTERVRGNNKYCFTVSVQPTMPEPRVPGSCASMDLHKIEWNIRPACWMSVTEITVGSRFLSASYARYPQFNATVFKMTNLGKAGVATATYQSTRVCITLGPQCPTLADFCAPGSNGGCAVAFFSPNNRCCPIQQLVSPLDSLPQRVATRRAAMAVGLVSA